MSKIHELIRAHCPNGVEYKKIQDVYTRLRGMPITATKMKQIACDNGTVRIFAGGKTMIDASESDIPESYIIRKPAVLVQSRGIIDVVYCDQAFTFKNEMWAYTAENAITVKFLFYVLQNNIQYFRRAASKMSSLPQISLRDTEQFLIPLPPLSVQEEIVRILDKFTELEAELELELDCRKRQYEYYRDKLLNFQDKKDVVWKTLGEVCAIRNGKDYKHLGKGDIPVYGSGGIMTYVDTYVYNKPTVLIPRKGSLANLFYVETPFWNVDTIFYTEVDTRQINVKYLYYLLAKTHLEKLNKAGGVPSLTQSTLNKIVIPILPLSEQERIVGILDKFHTLTHSLSEGLPKEIALRRRQYEYYRNALLSFPESKSAAG